MQVNYITRKPNKISSIKIDIKSQDIKNEKGKARFLNLMRYFTEYFICELELNQANYLVDYANRHNIDISNAIVLNHPKGEALCYLAQYSKLEVKPFITLSTSNFFSGWTFERGNFADVNIYCDNEYVMLIEQDTLYEQDLFLYWLMEKMEETFYTNDVYQTYPLNQTSYKIGLDYHAYMDYPKYEFLVPIVEDLINENKNKKIHQLKINGITANDYIIQNRIYQYCHSETELFKMCLFFKKPYNQVRKFVESKSRF